MNPLISKRVFAAAALMTSIAGVEAATLVFNVGKLPVESANNEFLFFFQSNNNGTYRPTPYFYSTTTGLVFGPSTTTYPQGDSQLFSFEYQFSVTAPSILSQNTFYSTLIGAGSSSVSILNGSSVIAVGTSTTPYSDGFNYRIPTIALEPNTTYTLLLTGRAPSAPFTGQYGFAQIPFDVSAVPEPSASWLLLASLGIWGIRRSFNVLRFAATEQTGTPN